MLLIHPDAANEIRAAAFAYQDVAHDLSQAFLEDIERAFERATSGEATSAYGLPEGLRAMPLERFGCRLYFFAGEEAAVAHRARDGDVRLYLVACRRIPRLLRGNAVRFAS